MSILYFITENVKKIYPQSIRFNTLIFFTASTSTFLSETGFRLAPRLCGNEEYLLLCVIALNHVKVLVVLPTIGCLLSVVSQHIEKGT